MDCIETFSTFENRPIFFIIDHNLFIMNKLFLFISISLLSFGLSAQNNQVKAHFSDDERIDMAHLDDFLQSLIGDEIDETDIEVFEIRSFGIFMFNKSKNPEEMTYGTLRQSILDMKAIPNYSKLRESFLMEHALKTTYVDSATWEQDQELFYFMPENSIDLIAFERYMDSACTKEDTYWEAYSRFHIYSENITYGALNELSHEQDPLNLTELKALAAKEGKPILLYFTGYNCVNCRRMENSTFRSDSIMPILLNDVVFYPLYIDSRERMPKGFELDGITEKQVQELLNKEEITVGDYHIAYQILKYEVSAQPVFILLNEKGELIQSTTGYESVSRYFDFLDGGIETYENRN